MITTILNKINCSKSVFLQNVIVCHCKKLGELNKNVESLYPCDFTSDFLLLGNSINVSKLPGKILAFAIKVLINTFIKSHLLNSFKNKIWSYLKEA